MGEIKFSLSTITFILVLLVLALAQDQSGFISIDCGVNEDYVDETTRIKYSTDARFTNTGVNQNILFESNLIRQYHTLRSFPDGTKNCYTLKPAQGKNNTYFIRAGFLYGDYDNKSHVPRFDLYLGANWWTTVRLNDVSSGVYYDIIHVPQSDNIDVCLVNTGFGTPFISFLELRLLNSTIYETKSGSLLPYMRDCGSTNEIIRFPNDMYDRIWSNFTDDQWEELSAGPTVRSIAQNSYQVPFDVMKTAVTQVNDNELRVGFALKGSNPTNQFYIYLHFAEIDELQPNQSRAFDIYINNKLFFENFVPTYLRSNSVYSPSPINGTRIDVRLRKAKNSTLPPLLNAFEVHVVKEMPEAETYKQDSDAIMEIKSFYNVDKQWQGDPCQPELAVWDGLSCSYDGTNPPRIIALNLSFSGLSGSIAPAIADLKMLQYLDLSDNSLIGLVPGFLSELPSLKVLNLEGNDLSGFIPQVLTKKSKNGSLKLSVGRNQDICTSTLCKHKFIVPLVATVGAVVGLLLVSMAIIWVSKRRKTGGTLTLAASLSMGHKFAYSEILSITNNLEKILGRGNLGTVYHGNLDEIPVAVKIFNQSYVQGYKQFLADAKIITKVQHRRLATCLGYFEGNDKGLIYEFTSNGSLEDILSGRNANCLSWQERLHIAMDVAQGLDYLHNSCRPPIIHGSLKPTNILFDENYQAKLVDFGFSKIVITEGGSTEYVDPEYYVTNKYTERSDVYSCGIVLLAVMTNKPVISSDKTHISQWVSFLMSRGDIKSVVDPRLKNDYHIDSVWKAVEIAMACASQNSADRPAIKQVVMELNQCLAMEINRTSTTIEMVSVNLSTSIVPQAR